MGDTKSYNKLNETILPMQLSREMINKPRKKSTQNKKKTKLHFPPDKPTNISKTEEIIMPLRADKSKTYCDAKAKSFRAAFELYYGVKLDFFTIPQGGFELAEDFFSGTHLNRLLTSIVPLNPEVCIMWDGVGVQAILNLCQIIPGHLWQVCCQDKSKQAKLTNNLKKMVGTFSGSQQVYADSQVASSTRNQTYDQYINDNNLWGGSRVAIHNSYPWEFFKNFAIAKKKSKNVPHLHLTLWEPPWNKEWNEGFSKIQADMTSKSPAENYARGIDKDLKNDLKFYQFETSPFDALKYLDQFIVTPMVKEGVTCKVIVFRIRGRINDKEWSHLSPDTNLKKKYAMTYQIEEIPHVRDDRMEYDNHKQQWDVKFENHQNKPLDPNRGRRGVFYYTIFQEKSDKLNSNICQYIEYPKRPEWYGAYFCCADSVKQEIYVKKDTVEQPCERILSKPKKELVVLLRKDFNLLTSSQKQEYHKIPALPRKIEVQIEDLSFLLPIFKKYIEDYNNGKTIPESRTQEIMNYVAQAEYQYKENANVTSQSRANDTPEQKEYGKELIHKKTDLFERVHDAMWKIEDYKNWKVHPVQEIPDDYKKAESMRSQINVNGDIKMSENLQVHHELQYLLSQLHELSTNWIIADGDGNCKKSNYSRRERGDNWRNHGGEYHDHERQGRGHKHGDYVDHTKQARPGRLGRDHNGNRRVY
jgi:hypothetical protein